MIISLSLILVGEEHIKKFNKYSIKSLERALIELNKNLNQEFQLTFFISIVNKDKTYIRKIIYENFKDLSVKIYFDEQISKIKKITYIDITKIQLEHLNKSKDSKSDYLLFLYSDMIYSVNSLSEAYKIINNNKKSVICSFALSLNINKYFNVFYKKIINNESYLDYMLDNKYNLISNFHNRFKYGNKINFKSNFIFTLKKNGIFIKSQHYHPIMIKVDKLKSNQKLISLDENIYELFNKLDEIYIERDMKAISIFSCDFESIERNKLFSNIGNKLFLKKNNVKKLNFLSLNQSVTKKNNKKIFYNNYIHYNKSKNLKMNAINNYFNYILHNKLDLLTDYFLNNDKKISKLNYNIRIKMLLTNVANSNIFYNNYYLRVLFNLFKKKIKLNNKDMSLNKDSIEPYLIIYSNLNLKNKLKFLFHL